MWEVEDLRRRVGLEEGDDSDDDTLEEIEAGAVAFVQQETNRYFGPAVTIVDYFNGSTGHRSRSFVSLSAPLTSLASVEWIEGAASSLGSRWSAQGLGIFDAVDGSRLEIIDGSAFPVGRRNVRVTYTGGYGSGAEPADVREAVAAIVNATYRNRQQATESDASPAGATSGFVVPQLARDVINNRRRWTHL